MLKIVSKQREQYIPQVKETLDNPDFILKDIDDMVILAKKIGDKQYFTSINLETEDFLISVSNAPKKENVLKNKVENEAKIVYQSPNASSISQTLLQTSLYSANKIDMLDYNEKKMKSQATQGEYERYIGYIMLKDEIFLDQKNKKHILTKETQEQWLKTFSLENLEQSYIPKHSKEIKEALGGKEIRLQKGSLLKLVSQGRQEFIPHIKAVLDEPDAIIKELSEEILLVKYLKSDYYFVNVSFDNGEYLVSISNGIKKSRNLKNKINAGAKIVYQSPNASSISQTLLQTSLYSANKIDMLDYNEKKMKSQATQGEQAMDMLRQEYKEKDIDKEKEFNRDKISRFGGKKK